MALHNDTGKHGEALAVAFLKTKGHIILATNYRYRRSEVDIVSTYRGILTFTEVKTRHGGSQVHPALSVNQKKQQLLKAAAAQYMIDNEYDWAMQFDIIAVILHDTGHELEHYQDVFF
jgi:putative endonuclease